MPRKGKVPKRQVLPDPVYGDTLVTQFINVIMKMGKKSVAERTFYNALKIVEQRTKKDGLEIFKTALNNVMPILEVRPRRVGGATYQVPVEVRPGRKVSLAMRWISGYARARAGRTMEEKLAREIIDAYNNTGSSIKKKDDTHRMAEANKAFAHYRW